MPRRHHESLGDMISTLSFLGVSVTLAFAAIDSFLFDNLLKGAGFSIASIMCLLGGFRYPIARLTDKFTTQGKNEK